ncbi:ABC transporter substrate-binding protein [Pseudomonas sp. 5P_3.1_Bac2]|uniref:ABC transporter substrate-binding protein n=1 Tax=Pseudomonas sp. 5P_3.1_Bac2 TaxID=2971617 RepID=UPI0021C99D3A|nr:ABC transporter substrate-binding protein [Pseudomonas sp. 5P_3.1_Bac2]MCU1717083.1 ABC transporter substrate-binding protein [Pseudomonas sp. 5P_3.1_Bac2]
MGLLAKSFTGALLGLTLAFSVEASSLIVGDQSYNTRAVMEAAGVLKDLPYELEWRQFTAGSPVAEALNVGSLDLGLLGDAPPLFLGALGAPIKVVAISQQSLAGVAILVRQDSPIKTLQDLPGKRAAIWKGSWSQQLLLSALDKAAVPRDSVEIRYLSALDASHALDSGAVDVIATWEPYVTQQERQGARVLATAEGLMAGQSFVVANSAVIEPKRAEISDFLTRLKQARAWATQSSEHNARYAQVWSGYSRADQAIAQAWFARAQTVLQPVSEQGIQAAQQTIDFFSGLGLIKAYPAASLFDNSFNPVFVP